MKYMSLFIVVKALERTSFTKTHFDRVYRVCNDVSRFFKAGCLAVAAAASYMNPSAVQERDLLVYRDPNRVRVRHLKSTSYYVCQMLMRFEDHFRD